MPCGLQEFKVIGMLVVVSQTLCTIYRGYYSLARCGYLSDVRLVYIQLGLGGKTQDRLGASLPYLGILSMSAKE